MENSKTILLVDVAGDDRGLLAIRLEGLGFRVLEAENLSQVQSVLRREKVDIAVAERLLPGLGGDLLLRSLEPQVRPVLLFTEQEPENLPSFLHRTGVKAVIPKKRRSELIERLTRMKNPAVETAASVKSSFFGKRILLLEDSPTVRHFIRRAIEQQNPDWTVLEATNAVQGLLEAGRKPVDVVVLDLEIPEMDGPAFVRVMREKFPMGQKPVLALAPCGRRDLKEGFGGDPHVVFLPKPVTASQVVEAIRSAVTEKKVLAGV